MIRAEVITPWIGDGTEDSPNRPQIGDDYAVSKWEDVTGQPAQNLPLTGSMLIVKIEADAAMIDAIEADKTYQILWSDEIANEIPE